MKLFLRRSACPALAAAALLLPFAGCGKPNRANIILRKESQDLRSEITRLQQRQKADEATIAGLTNRVGSLPTLPPDRLARLFTVHSIRLGRMTGGADLDASKPGQDGLKAYVELLDQHGDEIKSAGSFVVEAFELAGPEPRRLGRWEFPVEKAQDHWHNFLTRYEYVLPLPWQEATPAASDVTVRLTFTDELTGRQFTEQSVVKVQPAPATQPTTAQR
jgi:hypothetical protein